METQFLCGNVDAWQRRRIEMLETNLVQYPDIMWKIEDKLLPDCRQAYVESEFFRLLFESPLARGVETDGEVAVFPLDEKLYVFNMIRVFCHTGLVTYTKGESILRTIERYAAFRFYGIDQGKAIFRALISNTLTPLNAMPALEYAIHRHDVDILRDIEKYFCDYAFVVMRQKNFFGVKRESMEYVASLCMNDSLNISEADLLTYLYKLCEKKVGDKEYAEFPDAMSIFGHAFGPSGSLWGSIRLDRLTMPEFMEFVHKNTGAMTNDTIVKCMSTIYGLSSETSQRTSKRKLFQPISSYPRNLKLVVSGNPQVDITRWEREKLQVFFVFPFNIADTIHLPQIVAGNTRINCVVHHSEKCLGLTGYIHSGTTYKQSGVSDVNITVSIVNFRHDRWKKARTAVNLSTTPAFDLPNILSWNAIEGASGTSTGYTFDLNKYPDYSGEGAKMSLMMYFSMSNVNQNTK